MNPIRWDTIPRGTSYFMPFELKRVNAHTQDEIPYDLTGCVAFFTCKKEPYDGIKPKNWEDEDDPETIKYLEELSDNSSAKGLKDKMFRITVDCDDPSSGEQGPQSLNPDFKGFTGSYHGMYGEDPRQGRIIFRMGKQHTMIDPGSYYWDVRIMRKNDLKIGTEIENPVYIYAFGQLDIQGTPTNRATAHNWSSI